VLEQRIKRLLDEDLPPILKDVDDLRAEVAAARSQAESEAEKAFSAARAEILELAAGLDRTQTLDLRWAVLGLFISAIGTFLQYWA
jgi:hypothetical protein